MLIFNFCIKKRQRLCQVKLEIAKNRENRYFQLTGNFPVNWK